MSRLKNFQQKIQPISSIPTIFEIVELITTPIPTVNNEPKEAVNVLRL